MRRQTRTPSVLKFNYPYSHPLIIVLVYMFNGFFLTFQIRNDETTASLYSTMLHAVGGMWYSAADKKTQSLKFDTGWVIAEDAVVKEKEEAIRTIMKKTAANFQKRDLNSVDDVVELEERMYDMTVSYLEHKTFKKLQAFALLHKFITKSPKEIHAIFSPHYPLNINKGGASTSL